MNGLFLAVALALYLLATATFIAHQVTSHDALRRVALTLLAAAFGMHAASLALRAALIGYEVIATFHDELSFVACIMVGLYLLIATRTNLTVVGALVTPLAFLFALSSFAFNVPSPELSPRLQSIWLPAHVTLPIWSRGRQRST